MRVIFIVLSLVLLHGTLMSQVLDKGNFVIGSTLGFSTASSNVNQSTNGVDNDVDGPSSLQISLAPNVGYFLMDNFTLGIGMDYTFSRLKENNAGRKDDSDFLFGPFLRYYYPVDEGMAFFFLVDFGFGNSSDEQLINENVQRVSSNIFALGIGPGFTIYSSKSIGIESILKYNFARSEFDTESLGVKTQTVNKTNQFDISLGLQFYFGGLKSVEKAPNFHR